MKKNKLFIRLSLSALLLTGVAGSCSKDFLEKPPAGTYSGGSLENLKGVEGMLIGAYATLNGTGDNFYSGLGGNWLWGSVASDEAFKGSESSDQSDANAFENYTVQPSNGILTQKWDAIFDGVGMANQVLRALKVAEDVPATERTRIEAEARVIRGIHHFEGMRIFYRIPFVDETVTDFKSLTNAEPIWQQIEADIKFGYDNLPGTMENVGRVNKWASAAFLAKVYLFQKKYAEAKPVLDEIIANGTTADGVKYGLNESFHDNFRIATKNNKESVFAIQSSVNDNAQGLNGNYNNTLNYPHGAGEKPGGCCGFFQPSFSLVNSFKTDANGLPLLTNFNNENIVNDVALTSDQPFTLYQGTLDPRLDWTVGRRGIPYLDWGIHPGRSWIRKVDWGGPFSPKKHVHYRADLESGYQGGSWGQPTNAMNMDLIRFADVLLMAAEVEAEIGSLSKALEYVNQIRRRAANPAGFVKTANGSPAANYKISEYTSFPTKEFALQAIQFERKLELAMEGHRHFDLVRWGIAAPVINAYLDAEDDRIQHFIGVDFTPNQDEFWPIPTQYINRSIVNGKPNLQQPPGY